MNDKEIKEYIERQIKTCEDMKKMKNIDIVLKNVNERMLDFYITINNKLKALEIIKEKGLSLNELWYIERNEPWSVYIEKMREVYFDDPCVEEGKVKTQEEYDLLKEVLL